MDRPAIPRILTPAGALSGEEVRSQLKAAAHWADHLIHVVDAVFSGSLPARELACLTLDRSVATGDTAAERLLAAAFRINPLFTLDELELDLPHDAESQDAARWLLAKFCTPTL